MRFNSDCQFCENPNGQPWKGEVGEKSWPIKRIELAVAGLRADQSQVRVAHFSPLINYFIRMRQAFVFNGHGLEPREFDSQVSAAWIHFENPDRTDFDTLQNQFGVELESLHDILDIDERPRFEKIENGIFLIFRIPLFAKQEFLEYFTCPMGIFIHPDKVISVCGYNLPYFASFFTSKHLCNVDSFQPNILCLQVIHYFEVMYIKYLKEINRHVSVAESGIENSVKNTQLLKLLHYEKSLVHFLTSLKGNEILLEKIAHTKMVPDEDSQEILNDIMIENRQAIVTSNVNSDILNGMMDVFGSIINNNVNAVMKRMTVITLALMIPTLIASIYGMNVPLPFQTDKNTFWVLGVISAVLAGIAITLMRRAKIM